MDYSVNFAQQFSRLVSLIMHQPDVVDDQKAALRAMVAASQQGAVRLAVQGGVLVINGETGAENVPGTDELLSQCIGHFVREVAFDMAATPADMLNTARLLAAVPIEGDQGRDIDAKLRSLAMRSVRVSFERMDEANPDVVRQFTSLESANEDPTTLFDKLDATDSVAAASRLLDLVVAHIEGAGREYQPAVVAEAMQNLVRREGEQTDPEMRRAYVAAVRRVIKPTVLSAVASVLPHQRENVEGVLMVLARTGEEGAEALIEQLVASPSKSERRAFFDGLVHLKAGVPTLIHMLGDPRWYVVRNAADLLGELEARESEPALIDLLKHDNDRVRRAVAGALSKFGGAAAGRALKDVLDTETNLEVQIVILGALGRIATPDAIQRLQKAAESEGGFFKKKKPAAYRTAAQQALALARSVTNPSTTNPSSTD